jgi:hypothetical protein
MISGMGNDKISNDHWKRIQSQFMDNEQDDDINTFLGALRDLVSSASGNEVQGRKSSITLGRVLGSVINSQKAPKTELHREDDHQARTISRAELIKMMGPMFVSPTVATRLLDGWVKHLATRHPVIHTPRLRELHARRNEVLDVYEKSILHLVYANSGRYLETVSLSTKIIRREYILTLPDWANWKLLHRTTLRSRVAESRCSTRSPRFSFRGILVPSCIVLSESTSRPGSVDSRWSSCQVMHRAQHA